MLTSLFNASSNSKCLSLNNHQCINQPSLNNLYPNEYTQGLSYYPFSVNLDSCVGNCNNLNNYLIRYMLQAEHLNLSFQHNYRNNLIQKMNKAYIMQM